MSIGVAALGLLALLAVAALGIGFGFGRVARGSSGNVAERADAAAGIVLEGAYELPPTSHPLVQKRAPDFTLTRLDSGESDSLGAHLGEPVMVNFWATWCPPCRFEMPWIQAAHEAHPDLTILAVDAGERVSAGLAPDTISHFATAMGLTFPVLYGDEVYGVQNAWAVSGLPSTFMVSPDGTVTEAHVGMFPNQATLEQQILRFLATYGS